MCLEYSKLQFPLCLVAVAELANTTATYRARLGMVGPLELD